MYYVILPLVLVNLLLSHAESVVVTVEQGQLRGEKLQVVTCNADYYSFKGIPYAKPPVGDLRFMPPQPLEPWKGVRNALHHSSMCVQRFDYNKENITGSEDCLYLNVYTPRLKPKKPLTVMFFIHGGGLLTGSGNVDRYGPDYLITEDVVVVTTNYRLGALGFLTLNTEEVSGNVGLKDQAAAMRWVQRNIAAFGGDPNRVTILGQSGGAVSVGLHNISPMSKGLYQRAVMMSGGPLNDWVVPFQPRRVAFRLGQELGLWTLDDKELITYLKSLPAEKLFPTDPVVLKGEDPNLIIRQLLFVPTVETHCGNKFLTLDPLQALKRGKINDIDLLIGHVALEGLFFSSYIDDASLSQFTNYTEMVVPRRILENIAPANYFKYADIIRTRYFGKKPIDKNATRELVNYLSDTATIFLVHKYATLFSKYYKNTFMYKFSMQTDFPRYKDLSNEFGIDGPTHDDDLLYIFYPHSGNVTITEDSEQYKLVKTVCALYANFAKYGNPTPNKSLGVKWRQYNGVSKNYLDINSPLRIGQHYDEEVVSFWDSIYQDAGLPF